MNRVRQEVGSLDKAPVRTAELGELLSAEYQVLTTEHNRC